MSYEPRIIVDRKDLMNIRNQLWDDEVCSNNDKKAIAKELISALQHNKCVFKGIDIIIFKPEFSSFNEKVRNYLTKHNVEYSIDY